MLPVGNIHTFGKLKAKFVSDFMASKRQEKSNFHLLSITQQEGESVSTYLQKEVVLEVTNLEESVALNALINKMRTPKLNFQLFKSQVKTYVEAMRQCQSFVTAFEVCQAQDTTKRKHDKRDQGLNHSNKAHRDEYSSRKQKAYPPHHQGPPSEMGHLRSRHVYITKEEP